MKTVCPNCRYSAVSDERPEKCPRCLAKYPDAPPADAAQQQSPDPVAELVAETPAEAQTSEGQHV